MPRGGRLRVVVLGLGPIGRAVCREIASSGDLELAGAVDPAPSIAGRDLGGLLRDARLARRRVAATLDGVPARRADVAAHLTTSRFARAAEQLRDLVRRGLPTASTCEELIAARERWPREAGALDRAARRAGVPLLATGVNPGFVMDLLPAALTNVCVRVRRVRVTRHVDTATRRRALQEKTGAGIQPAEFRRRLRDGSIGHVGLADSALFLLRHLPLEAELEGERIRPLVAARSIRRGRRLVRKGEVAGVHQTVKARDPTTGRLVLTLDLRMAFGLRDPHDEIRIDGDPPVRVRVDGGVPGDRATVGAVLSALRFLPEAPPGLGA